MPTEEEILARLNAVQDDDEVLSDPNISPRLVEGASGMVMEVMNQMEEDWWNSAMTKYMDQYSFENVSDLADLDRLVAAELLSMRYAYWLARGKDYKNEDFVVKSISDLKLKEDTEIRLLKKQMGMDRKGRIESEQESVADYLKNLLRRGKEFGVHRDMQVAKAIDLFMELKKLVGLNERSDEEETVYLGVSDEEIVQWVREVAIPEFEKIDEAFRKNQRIWIKEVS